MSKAFFFLGPPGSGKDTQAELFAVSLGGVPVVSTGDVIRQMILRGDVLALQAQEFTKRGDLVPDEVIFSLLEEYLQVLDLSRGVVFTGFPRSLGQSELMDGFLVKLGLEVGKVFNLDTTEATSISRILKRVREDTEAGKGPRADDLEAEAVKQRLSVYNREVEPILEFFEKRGQLSHIDNERLIEEVSGTIRDVAGLI